MGVHIKWDPNWERNLKKEVDRNLGPAVEERVRDVKCDVHPQHEFRVIREEAGWVMTICCEDGGNKAAEEADLQIEGGLPRRRRG